MTNETYDVVVIGGGAAGLSGALALGRARRSVLVIDAGAPRNAPAAHVHNYLGREGMPPGDLLAAGRAEVASYGGEVVTGTVTSAQVVLLPEGDAGAFRVELADGRPVLARRLLVTTAWSTSCPTCPGWPSGGVATSCTARTATAGRSATRRSVSWPAARWRRTRPCCSGSGART